MTAAEQARTAAHGWWVIEPGGQQRLRGTAFDIGIPRPSDPDLEACPRSARHGDRVSSVARARRPMIHGAGGSRSLAHRLMVVRRGVPHMVGRGRPRSSRAQRAPRRCTRPSGWPGSSSSSPWWPTSGRFPEARTGALRPGDTGPERAALRGGRGPSALARDLEWSRSRPWRHAEV